MARLPGARSTWVILWGFLPILRLPILYGTLRLTGQAEGWEFFTARTTQSVVFVYAVFLSLWAARRFTNDAHTLAPSLTRLAAAADARSFHPFRAMGSIAGPLVLTGIATAVSVIDWGIRYGAAAAALASPLPFLVNLPLMTGFWGYLVLLAGLDRLGRERLALDPFPEDRSLGLRPVGAVAFTAFRVFAAGFLPVLFLTATRRSDLVLDLALFGAGVVIFFLSLWRIHQQMLAAKRRYVEWARELYARAVEPVRASGDPEVLRAQSSVMSAAESLERRAEAIQHWPFDESTVTRIAAITTGVVTAIITRVLLSRIGL